MELKESLVLVTAEPTSSTVEAYLSKDTGMLNA